MQDNNGESVTIEQVEQMTDELSQRVALTKQAEDRAIYEGTVKVTETVAMTDAQLASAVDTAPVPEKPKPPTKKEWGIIMRLYFTVQRGRAKQCGHRIGTVQYSPDGNHKVVINSEPRDNCEFCWFAFFNENADMVATADQCFAEEGEATLVRIRGKKFTKNFKKFMSTMTRFKQEMAEQAEQARKEMVNGSSEVAGKFALASGEGDFGAGTASRADSEAVNDEGAVGSAGLGERADQQAIQD